MSAEVLARWEAFQQKIQQRFQEVMQEAEAGFRDLIASDPTDAITFGNAERGIHARVEALVQKLHETFSSQVTLNVVGHGLDAAIDRIEQQADSMRAAWQRLSLRAETNLYRAMYARVAVEMQRPVPCTNCGSPLAKTVPHRVEAVTCPACHTVVQAGPAPVVATYFGGAGKAFANAATFDKRLAIDAQRRRAQQARKAQGYAEEPLASLQEWERWARLLAKLLRDAGAHRPHDSPRGRGVGSE